MTYFRYHLRANRSYVVFSLDAEFPRTLQFLGYSYLLLERIRKNKKEYESMVMRVFQIFYGKWDFGFYYLVAEESRYRINHSDVLNLNWWIACRNAEHLEPLETEPLETRNVSILPTCFTYQRYVITINLGTDVYVCDLNRIYYFWISSS